MEMNEMLFWEKWPELLPLYNELKKRLLEAYPDMRIKVSKTQISFYNKHMFAMASPPARRRKEWPKEFMLVSFGLSHPVDDPQIAMSTEAYPGRWTHHVTVEHAGDINETLLEWIEEAYAFAAGKR